ICLYEGQQLSPDMEVPHDKKVGLRRTEHAQSPIDRRMQSPVKVGEARAKTAKNLDPEKEDEDERAHNVEHPLARPRRGAFEQSAFGVRIDRQALIEIQRQPRIGIARVKGRVFETSACHTTISSICSA